MWENEEVSPKEYFARQADRAALLFFAVVIVLGVLIAIG